MKLSKNWLKFTGITILILVSMTVVVQKVFTTGESITNKAWRLENPDYAFQNVSVLDEDTGNLYLDGALVEEESSSVNTYLTTNGWDDDVIWDIKDGVNTIAAIYLNSGTGKYDLVIGGLLMDGCEGADFGDGGGDYWYIYSQETPLLAIKKSGGGIADDGTMLIIGDVTQNDPPECTAWYIDSEIQAD